MLRAHRISRTVGRRSIHQRATRRRNWEPSRRKTRGAVSQIPSLWRRVRTHSTDLPYPCSTGEQSGGWIGEGVERTVPHLFALLLRILAAEGDLDIFDKWSSQRVAVSEDEDGEDSSESGSSDSQGEEDEIESDV